MFLDLSIELFIEQQNHTPLCRSPLSLDFIMGSIGYSRLKQNGFH